MAYVVLERRASKGKKWAEIGLSFDKVSETIRSAWTPQRKAKIKEVMREVAREISKVWYEDPELRKLAGQMADKLFGKVKVPEDVRRTLKASRFKYKRGDLIIVVGLPTSVKVEFSPGHPFASGTRAGVAGGYAIAQRPTDNGVEVIDYVYLGVRLDADLVEKVNAFLRKYGVDPSWVRNKFGQSLAEALSQLR